MKMMVGLGVAGAACAVGVSVALIMGGARGDAVVDRPRAAADVALESTDGSPGDGVVSRYVSRGPGKPCAVAEHLTDPSQISTEVPVYLATRPFDDAWTCGTGTPPFVMYGNVQVYYSGGAAGVDPGRHIDLLIDQQGGKVEDVNGRPAWVRQGAAARGTYTHVWFPVDDTIISLLAPPEVSVAAALSVARSLHVPAP